MPAVTRHQAVGLAAVWVVLALTGESLGRDVAADSGSNRHIRYSFTLTNTTNRAAHGVEFWAYLPLCRGPVQACAAESISQPHDVVTDAMGNRIIHCTFGVIPPHGSRIVKIRADLSMGGVPLLAEEGTRGAFLDPGPHVESDAPEIKELASKLRGNGDQQTAENIYAWVRDNVEYAGYIREDRGALYALRQRKGDCTEYASLFVALCRASAIPARVIAGYVCEGNCVLKPTDYHNWAEYHVAGAWRFADPQKAVFAEGSSEYVALQIVGGRAKNPLEGAHRFRVSHSVVTARMD